MGKLIKLKDADFHKVEKTIPVIHGLLKRGDIMAISAPKSSFKTSLAIHLALSLSHGYPWLNWSCQKSQVLFVNLNNTENDCLMNFYKVISEIDVISDSGNIDIFTLHRGIKLSEFAKELSEIGKEIKYDVIVIDAIDDVVTANNWEPQGLMTYLSEIVRDCANALVFTHSHRIIQHKGITNKEGASMSEVLNYSDVLLEFTKGNVSFKRIQEERLKAVWEQAKNDFLHYARNYYKMNVKDDFISKPNHTAEHLREHLETALNGVPEKAEVLERFDKLDIPIKNRTYWSLEVIASDYPPHASTGFIFTYPLLKQDNSIIIQEEKNASNPIADDTVNKLCDDVQDYYRAHGEYPNKTQLSKYIGISRNTLYQRLEKAKGFYLEVEGKIMSM